MALTVNQLKDLGFKDSKKSTGFSKKFNTLVYPLNKTDYLYFGYDYIRKEPNYKIVWKSFLDLETDKRISYMITNIGATGFNEMKAFLRRSHQNANYKPSKDEVEYLDGKDEKNLGNDGNTSTVFSNLQIYGVEDVEESDPVFIKIS